MPGPFRLTVDSFDGIPVLRLGGGLVFGENLTELRDTVLRFRSDGHERIVVDVTDVESTDSSGISALLAAGRVISESGGSIVLLRPSERLRAALAMVRVTWLFEVVDDEAALTRRVAEWRLRSSSDREPD